MKKEYAIKISLTKHNNDDPTAPYYWSLLKFNDSWHQIALGWEKTPQECFHKAKEYYESLSL